MKSCSHNIIVSKHINTNVSNKLLISLVMAAFLILSLLTTVSSSAMITKNVVVDTSGLIIYPSPLRLMGVDQFSIFAINEANIAAMHQYGANAFRETTYMGDWSDSNYQAKLVQVSQWAAKYDMKFILGCTGTTWDPIEGFSQMLANVIYNPTARANWINMYGDIIRQVQPYGVNPMNEPPVIADTSYASTILQEKFVADYKDFVLQCIDSWTAIKPDLVFFVEGSPFYDISTVLNSPRIDQSRPNVTVYYSVHYHYSYDNADPNTWGYHDDVQCGYWNARTAADLAVAETALTNHFFYNDGVKAALNAGVNVVFEEIGANINNPNVLAYEQDVFDFANTHNISVLWHSWGPSGSYGIGLLTDWTPTLNPMGQVWESNMP